MRVTSELQSQQAILNIQQTYARLTKLQTQISTGKQIQVASDDPTGAVQILQNNARLAQMDSELTSIQNAGSVLQASVTALQNAQKVLTAAKNAGLTANNPTNQAGANAALAAQVDSALNQLLAAANTQQPDGTYLFSGAASTTVPFSVTSNSSGQVTSVHYQGSQQDSQFIVSKTQTVKTLLAGNNVFQPDLPGGTITFTGSTGAAPGVGTDSAAGQVQLQVQHTQTTFGGSSGVQPGMSSATGDTVLGPFGANTLAINDTSGDGTSGTVSLNGGSAIAFTNSDTDLMVTGPSGEVIYLDTSSIVAGFNGTESITGDGTLSVDGGVTTTPIDFSTSQAITDGTTGAITNVNSSNIRKAGNEQVDYPGRMSIFQTLIKLRDTIANTDNLSSADRSSTLDHLIGQIDKFNQSMAVPLGNQANQAQFLSTLKTRTSEMQLNLKETTSNIQSTNMAEAIVSMQQQQILYQAGLQLAATMNQLSLANFIK